MSLEVVGVGGGEKKSFVARITLSLVLSIGATRLFSTILMFGDRVG